jgi:hypothetical protein
MSSVLPVILAAPAPSGGGSSEWALALGVIGTILALSGLLWNVYNALTDRRARRTPDVHGVVAGNPGKPSYLGFVNAGQGLARSVQYLLYEPPRTQFGGLGVTFLLPEQAVEIPLDFEIREMQSDMVWLYMDVQGRVYARSNYGKTKVHPKGSVVSLKETFIAMYPGVQLPEGLRDLVVGE